MTPRPLAFVPLALSAAIACSSSSAPKGPTARACTITPPAASDWRLVPDGTNLRDALGRVVSLRGVDAGGRSKTAPFVPFDYAPGGYAQALGSYMDRAASWGIDVLRVPFTWEAVEPTQGADDADFLSRYDQLLDAAWARGIWTVVDFHQDVYAQNFCGDGFPAWTLTDPPAVHHDCAAWATMYSDPKVMAAFDTFWTPTSSVQTAFLALWDRMVARYEDKAGVIGFEPINEPSAGSASPDAWEANVLGPFYARVAAKMNAAAPKALVFLDLSGPDGSFLTTTLTWPAGSNLVFAPHFYPFTGGEDPTTVLGNMQRWATLAAQWKVPTFVGEFGVVADTPAARDYMAAHFDAFDQLAIGGTEWEYSQSATSWNDEGMSIVNGDGTEHLLVDAIARPYARAVAGSAITTSWDASSRTFDLAYTPSSGVTEVALPARAFPSGYDVDLSGGCYDAQSVPGRMLVLPDSGQGPVSLRLRAH